MKRFIRGLIGSCFVALVGSALVMSSEAYAQGSTPCPVRPNFHTDHNFDFDRDAQWCRFGDPPIGQGIEGNLPEARYGRVYSVYCPGAMTEEDRLRVARALTTGTLTLATHGDARDRGTPNPIPRDYGYFGLTSRDVSGSPNHRFIYKCGHYRRSTTHIKFGIHADATAAKIAEYCNRVATSSFEQQNKHVDYEYKCRVHFRSGERTKADEVGAILLRDYVRRRESRFVSTLNLRACVLDSTDFQCAPCKSTDKLVVRVKWVRDGVDCPRNSTRATP